MTEPLPRRQFIKGLFLGTISSTFLNQPWSSAYAAEYSAATGSTGTISLNLQDYPPLQEPLGSIRIGVNPIEPGEAGPQGAFYPFIINRGENDDFYVLSSRCTHLDCVVRAYEPAESGLPCPCHGSLYALNGEVIRGPAPLSLDAYDFTRDGDLLTIQVPDLSYRVALSLVTDPLSRAKLTFTASPFIEYEICYREKITDAWSTVPFSQTANGDLSETVYTRTDDTGRVSLYAGRSTITGFYAVSMRVKDLSAIP